MRIGILAALLIIVSLTSLSAVPPAMSLSRQAAAAFTEGVPLSLPALASQAGAPGLRATTLSFAPTNVLIGVAGNVVIQIQLDAVSDLYGYQFQVTYDAAKVSATGAFVNSFFDTTTNTSIPAGWNAACSGGSCRFAAARTSPGVAVSGSGAIAQITFTGLIGGMSPLAFSADILSNRDGFALAHSSGSGLVTVCTGSALVQMTPSASKIAIGQSVAVTVEGLCLSNFYGYQFQIDYDATKLSASGAFVDSFFDTTTNASIPGGWDHACSDGHCRFAATKLNPAVALTGSGPLAMINFSALHAGVIPVSFGADLISDRDGMPIGHVSAGATITVYGYATIEGTVRLQGRAAPITPGNVTFTETTGVYPPTTVTFAADTGNFSASVPVDPGGMLYDVLGQHWIYLSNLRAGLAVQPEQTYTLPVTTLSAGDANNDGIVNIQDLSCIGNDFSSTPGTCGGLGSTDVNADGVINIFDLSVTGGNYELRSPRPW